MLTQEIVREFLDYDPESGVLTWRARDRKWFKTANACGVWNSRFAGKQTGCPMARGHLRLAIFGRLYLAHRVIWLWMTGVWPEDQIDHENHKAFDNRWSNLRQATNSENGKNHSRRFDNVSGAVGVIWHKVTRKWQAHITVDGRWHYLGLFADKADAIAAREAATAKFGFHRNHGLAA